MYFILLILEVDILYKQCIQQEIIPLKNAHYFKTIYDLKNIFYIYSMYMIIFETTEIYMKYTRNST